MKDYMSPEVEFVKLDYIDTMTVSACPEHVCDYDYGNICDGRPYSGQP